jgi:small subunit ribosomal protein S7
VLVTQLVNRLMSDGKKSIAERVADDAPTQVADKSGKPAPRLTPPSSPSRARRSRRAAARTTRSVEVPRCAARRDPLPSRTRERREKGMEAKLAGEPMDAIDQQAARSGADDMFRMAQANGLRALQVVGR